MSMLRLSDVRPRYMVPVVVIAFGAVTAWDMVKYTLGGELWAAKKAAREYLEMLWS